MARYKTFLVNLREPPAGEVRNIRLRQGSVNKGERRSRKAPDGSRGFIATVGSAPVTGDRIVTAVSLPPLTTIGGPTRPARQRVVSPVTADAIYAVYTGERVVAAATSNVVGTGVPTKMSGPRVPSKVAARATPLASSMATPTTVTNKVTRFTSLLPFAFGEASSAPPGCRTLQAYLRRHGSDWMTYPS